MSRRIRWGVGLFLIVVAFIVGFTLMLVPDDPDTLVNSVHQVIHPNGLRVIGLIIAAVATLSAFGLGILEAIDATENPERHHETK